MSTGAEGRVFEIGLHDYVAGVVAAETSPDWPDAALQAQAVASRTYTLHRLAHPRTPRYDVLATTLDQYFVRPHLVPARVWTSVERTRSEYLTTGSTSRSPMPFTAFFHASCGGGTDLPTAVWPAAVDEHHAAVNCEECLQSPIRWHATIGRDELLRTVGLVADGHRPVAVDVDERTPSGRIRLVGVMAGGRRTVIAAETLRAQLGYARVRSTRFICTPSRDGFQLHGVGHGHGVGLCQYGARGLAARGASYREILAHYYPQSRVVEREGAGGS